MIRCPAVVSALARWSSPRRFRALLQRKGVAESESFGPQCRFSWPSLLCRLKTAKSPVPGGIPARWTKSGLLGRCVPCSLFYLLQPSSEGFFNSRPTIGPNRVSIFHSRISAISNDRPDSCAGQAARHVPDLFGQPPVRAARIEPRIETRRGITEGRRWQTRMDHSRFFAWSGAKTP